jgi:cyclopropane fatty-acyl-phospholipid synthase-like methyltransferase
MKIIKKQRKNIRIILMNEKIFKYYDEIANKIDNPLLLRNKAKDFTYYDVEFLKKFSDKNKILLDLGSGTGLTINNLINNFKKIIAVEKYKEFSKFISKEIEIINLDLKDINLNELNFDIVTLFGVMNYFSYDEAKELYKKIYDSFEGTLIIKNQFGINEDVIVDKFSEELNSYYYSEYRYLQKEIKLLENIGFKIKEVVDIYPPEYNRWDNTHFYAIVCDNKKR